MRNIKASIRGWLVIDGRGSENEALRMSYTTGFMEHIRRASYVFILNLAHDQCTTNIYKVVTGQEIIFDVAK